MTYCWDCKKYSFCRNITCETQKYCSGKHQVRVISKYSDSEQQVLSTFIEADGLFCNNGHEIEVLFTMSEDELIFMGGRESNRKGDWFWNPNDMFLFECEHPGLLKAIETDVVNNNIRFVM